MTPVFNANFAIFDTDNDGRMSSHDFTIYIESIGADPHNAKECFDGLDTDRDGYITTADFVAAAIELAKSQDEKSCGRFIIGLL